MSRNPYRTCPGVVERGQNLIHLCLRDVPEVVGYQFWAYRTVSGAYGDPLDSGVGGVGPMALFQVPRGGGFRSPSLRRTGRGQITGSTKGQTHAVFAGDDYAAPAAGLSSVPPDEHWLFLRVQEERLGAGLLALAGIPEATVTLVGVLAGDQVTIKGVVFEFAAGANNLAGKAGTLIDPFLVGLGANDVAAAANLTLALNDNGDVAPVMDALALLNTHTFATNVGAPSAVVLVQPENGAATLLAGNTVQFTITSTDQGRVALDVEALAVSTLVWEADAANPVLGSIYCIPPALHFGSSQPSFTMQATAPSNTGSLAGGLPNLSEDLGSVTPRAMHLVFPNWLGELLVRNLSLNNLLLSFGPGQMMRNIPTGAILDLTSGKTKTKELLLACPDAGGADFTLHGVAATEMV